VDGKDVEIIPTAVVRQSEMEIPWRARKIMSAVAEGERATARVKTVVMMLPVRKVRRRPRMSAMLPARSRVQPHVNLNLLAKATGRI
jgi:hypothetical protein